MASVSASFKSIRLEERSMTASKPTVVELAHLSNLVYGGSPSVKVLVAKPPLAPPASPEQEWILSASSAYPGGFSAAMYRRQDGCRALAFRGTDNIADDFRDDVAIAFGRIPPQIEYALAFARSVGLSQHDAVTGHSLGGALALLVAAADNHPAVTFNAPGVADSCARVAADQLGTRVLQMMQRCGGFRRVLNIRIGGDPVSSRWVTGDQVGAGGSMVTLPDANGCTARAAQQAARVGSRGMRLGPKAGAVAATGAFLGLNALCRHQMETVLAAVQRDPRYFVPIVL
jgi:hypothetical protein